MGEGKIMAIEYQWLKGAELDVLEPVLADHGWMSLNQNTSIAIAAFDGDKLLGFFIFQSIPFLGPLLVTEEGRGSNLAKEFVAKMAEFLHDISCRGCIVTAENPIVEGLCEQFGMVKLETPVYIRNEAF
jgi:hypothetical protein